MFIRNLFKIKKTGKLTGRLVIGQSARGVAVVYVDRASQVKPSVKCCTFTEEDAEKLGDLCETADIAHYPCTYLLSAREYSMLRVDIPKVPSKELKAAIRWQVKDMLDYPVEDATVDALEIPHKGETQQADFMYAIVAPNEIVRKCMIFSNAAELQLDVIDIPEMAQRNLATFFEQPERVLMLLSFSPDSDDCLLTFTAGGELYRTRRIEVSSRQITDEDEDNHTQYLERLVLELQRSIDHFDRQRNAMSFSGLMLAPFSGVDMLQRYLAANLDVNVSVMNLNDVLDLSEVLGLADDIESQWHFFSFLGAALRVEQGAIV